jgi:SNF2 family DNA or RNA helicase
MSVPVTLHAAIIDEHDCVRELERLARLKTPLVKIRGQWVHVDQAELQAALARVKRSGSRTMSVRDAVRLAIGAPVAGIPSGTALVANGAFAEELARLQGAARLETLEPPATLQAVLRPYQTRGYSWLHVLTRSGFGACLADDMGLGKTVQTLALIARNWEDEPHAPVLLVCPTSVIGNWQREAARFTPSLPLHVHHGSDRRRGADFAKLAGVRRSSLPALRRGPSRL